MKVDISKGWIIATLLLVLPCATALGQKNDIYDPSSSANLGRLEFTQYLDNLAYQKTAARRVKIASITTRAEAEAHQAEIRQKILTLIGGLPERTPLHARIVGSSQGNGFHVEKVIFDSQPGFPVTALLYLPNTKVGSAVKKLPAIVITPGHAPQGKSSDYVFSSTFARNGFAVLEYDPIGQGERLQYLNPTTGQSYVGGPTAEHGEAGLQPTLIGDAVSRYFIWDGMRAVDYLQSLPEIDPDRIGAFGCSGGGTITAMLGALEPSLKAIGVACFTTNFDTMLPAIGPQDAEQSIPNFINSGLDIPDWAESAAPIPYAIIATYSDMFPFAGAQQTEDEVRRFYKLFGANSDLEFLTGPGHHGDILPIFPSVVSFFLRHLQPSADAEHPTLPLPVHGLWYIPPANLPKDFFQDTTTGQVATSYPHAETIHTLNLKRATVLLRQGDAHGSVDINDLQTAIRDVTKADLRPDTQDNVSQAGYLSVKADDVPSLSDSESDVEIHHITMHVEQGIDLQGEIAEPHTSGRHPAILLLTSAASMSTGNPDYELLLKRLQHLAGSGQVVLALTPRPSPPGVERTTSPFLGDFYQSELRAELTGKTIMGMRIDDTIRAVNYLSLRHDVDPDHITGYASYHLGLVLLHAAVLDSRFSHISVDHVLNSYRGLLEAPMPIRASEDILPGVLRRYDIPNLIHVLGARLTLTTPLTGKDDLSASPLKGNLP